jgi:hypothetical protein
LNKDAFLLLKRMKNNRAFLSEITGVAGKNTGKKRKAKKFNLLIFIALKNKFPANNSNVQERSSEKVPIIV